MVKVLSLSSLFPDATRPQFGCFVERQTIGLAARDGVEVEVVAPIGIAPWPLSLHRHYRRFDAVPARETYQGLTVHRPRFPVLPKIGAGRSWRAMARRLGPLLEEIHERFPFDVIDAEFFYPDGPAAMLLGRKIGVPWSIKARGTDIHYWAMRADCTAAIGDAAAGAAGLLAVSEALKSDMAALGMEAAKITVHYTGIDRSLFRPDRRTEARAKLGLDGPVLVSVGALIERKRHDLAIAALADIPDAQLIFVGDGPERAKLAKLAKSLGVADRVRFAGRQPREAVADWLAAADVMVLMSESEGLANAWVEALASGTPIVIADAGGARELLDRPEAGRPAAGRIVEQDPQSVASAVRALLVRPPDPAVVAATVDGFSWDTNAEMLEAHLRKCAAGSVRR